MMDNSISNVKLREGKGDYEADDDRPSEMHDLVSLLPKKKNISSFQCCIYLSQFQVCVNSERNLATVVIEILLNTDKGMSKNSSAQAVRPYNGFLPS